MTTKIRLVIGLTLVAVFTVGAFALWTAPPAEAAPKGGQPCGGITGLQCPSPNQMCMDDPRDDCDPKRGGADCIGICRGPGGGSSQ